MTIELATLSAARQAELDYLHHFHSGDSTRILSALGHPGYSQEFARQVLSGYIGRPTLSLHEIIAELGNEAF